MIHYYVVFQARDTENHTRVKLEAHVFALCREECDLLLKKKVNSMGLSLWVVLDVKVLPNRLWKVGGKKTQLSSHVDSITEFVEFSQNESFTEFLALYRDSLRMLPTNTATRWLAQEKPQMLCFEQIYILADYTGESVETLTAKMKCEYMAKFVMHAMENNGRAYVHSFIGRNAIIPALRGDMTYYEAVASMPTFGEEIPLQAGELLYFMDIRGATSSEAFLYRDDSKFEKLSTRTRESLCACNTKFVDIFKALNLTYIILKKGRAQ